MVRNAEILAKLIDEDFGFETKENSRWGKATDHDSLVLDKEKGIFFWNSKELSGGAISYLMGVRKLSFPEAKKYLANYEYEDTFTLTVNTKVGDVYVYPKLVDVFFEYGQEKDKRQYWYNRGISDSTIDRFRLGWYNNYNTVPIFMDNALRQFQLRSDNINGKRSITNYYKNVGPVLFNSDILKFTDKVYVTEGLTDCLRLTQEGLPAVSGNAGSGGWLTEWFIYFMRQKEIVVIYDNDRAGKHGVGIVASCLGQYRTKIFTFPGYDDKFDLVDFFNAGGNVKELEALIEEHSMYLYQRSSK